MKLTGRGEVNPGTFATMISITHKRNNKLVENQT